MYPISTASVLQSPSNVDIIVTALRRLAAGLGASETELRQAAAVSIKEVVESDAAGRYLTAASILVAANHLVVQHALQDLRAAFVERQGVIASVPIAGELPTTVQVSRRREVAVADRHLQHDAPRHDPADAPTRLTPRQLLA